MKNFVIATVSAVALLGAHASANEKAGEMKNKQHAEMHHDKMHHGQKHHGKMHHHRHHGHALAVYVNYPPVNVDAFSACPCEYYQDKQEHAYIWHEGYFWYPHPHGEMLKGYTPHQMLGSYWYPSRLHPHAVYIDGKGMAHEIYPVAGAPKGAKHHPKAHHKGQKMKHHAKKAVGTAMPAAPIKPVAPAGKM